MIFLRLRDYFWLNNLDFYPVWFRLNTEISHDKHTSTVGGAEVIKCNGCSLTGHSTPNIYLVTITLLLLVLHLAPENANFSFGLAPSTIRTKHHHSSPPVITCIDDVIVRIEMGLYSSRKLIILENAYQISKRFVKFTSHLEIEISVTDWCWWSKSDLSVRYFGVFVTLLWKNKRCQCWSEIQIHRYSMSGAIICKCLFTLFDVWHSPKILFKVHKKFL